MPRWDPSPIWTDQDVYIIGGGPSLQRFDWGLIRGKNTIGCNSAFVLGAEFCKKTIFGDIPWWEKIGRTEIEATNYQGTVIGCAQNIEQLEKVGTPWLFTYPWTQAMAVCTKEDRALAFNGNTGSLAINAALLLGARRVLLLGFDMKPKPAPKSVHKIRPNWHDLRWEPPRVEVYPRFMALMKHIPKQLAEKFPGRQIINVTNDSALEVFPKVKLQDHFGRET